MLLEIRGIAASSRKAEFLCYLYCIMEHSKIILDIFSPDIVFGNVVSFNLSPKRSLFFVCNIFFASYFIYHILFNLFQISPITLNNILVRSIPVS